MSVDEEIPIVLEPLPRLNCFLRDNVYVMCTHKSNVELVLFKKQAQRQHLLYAIMCKYYNYNVMILSVC